MEPVREGGENGLRRGRGKLPFFLRARVVSGVDIDLSRHRRCGAAVNGIVDVVISVLRIQRIRDFQQVQFLNRTFNPELVLRAVHRAGVRAAAVIKCYFRYRGYGVVDKIKDVLRGGGGVSVVRVRKPVDMTLIRRYTRRQVVGAELVARRVPVPQLIPLVAVRNRRPEQARIFQIKAVDPQGPVPVPQLKVSGGNGKPGRPGFPGRSQVGTLADADLHRAAAYAEPVVVRKGPAQKQAQGAHHALGGDGVVDLPGRLVGALIHPQGFHQVGTAALDGIVQRLVPGRDVQPVLLLVLKKPGVRPGPVGPVRGVYVPPEGFPALRRRI